MSTITKGYTFGATELVTNTKLHTLVDSATLTGTIYATADDSGVASQIGLSNVSNITANGVGVGTILFKGATSRNSDGFIKVYIGTTAYYIPVFSAITG